MISSSSTYCLIVFSTLITSELLLGQQPNDTVCVAFWNLENLFDTVDDQDKDDEEFLPDGKKEWTEERLDKKSYNISRVIRSINNGVGPDILGVCEVEHQSLLDNLISEFLPDKNYKTTYIESPDNRGIDNGLIYNADKFTLLSMSADTVQLSDGYPTRLILNVILLTELKDTLIVFVNHWPSRRGGEVESEPNRISAGETLKKSVGKYSLSRKNPNIIILGDFNDEPANNSLLKTLKAEAYLCDSVTENGLTAAKYRLFNLSYKVFMTGEGSYKYRDDWNMLDQIIVSNALLSGDIEYICSSFEVFKPELMITRTGKYTGTPFPTYGGSRYLGGYSDHFPVTAKFLLRKQR